jgi:hypothetical protein
MGTIRSFRVTYGVNPLYSKWMGNLWCEPFHLQNEIITDTDLNLPPVFLKLGTDELSDIGRKLDKGVKLLEALPGIKESVSMLPSIKESVSMLPDIKTGIDAMNLKFDVFIDEQRTHNKRMGQILQKLAEK